jgi:hypothetical protein
MSAAKTYLAIAAKRDAARPPSHEEIAADRADWLVDAVATATQDRRYLRGDPDEDTMATAAILLNGHKAILIAIQRAMAASGVPSGSREPTNGNAE